MGIATTAVQVLPWLSICTAAATAIVSLFVIYIVAGAIRVDVSPLFPPEQFLSDHFAVEFIVHPFRLASGAGCNLPLQQGDEGKPGVVVVSSLLEVAPFKPVVATIDLTAWAVTCHFKTVPV